MAAWYFCGLGLLRTSSAPPKAHNSAAASSRLTAFALASPGHDRIKTKSHDQFEADADNSHGPQRNARGHRHGAGLGLALALRGRRSAALTAARASSRTRRLISSASMPCWKTAARCSTAKFKRDGAGGGNRNHDLPLTKGLRYHYATPATEGRISARAGAYSPSAWLKERPRTAIHDEGGA
jgi:hypothetical protein